MYGYGINILYIDAVIIYVLCFGVSINSKTSTYWKLSSDRTKIIEGNLKEVQSNNYISKKEQTHVDNAETLFGIIVSTEPYGHTWIKHEMKHFCLDCPYLRKKQLKNVDQSKSLSDHLSCGKPVNYTYYDTLVGVLNRHKHSGIEEPEVLNDFSMKYRTLNGKTLDLETLETKLKHMKKQKPKSVQLFNQLGNYWRIRGESNQAIECFRKGLSISPHNPEVLLNLAKVLFHLQYLDDAIYLTRRSLEVSPPEKGAWQQYFTLGEIFKAYGHYQEATLHLRHSLELNPGYEPALKLLKEMEMLPATTLHIYTLIIIICLVMGVLLVIASASDCNDILDETRRIPSTSFHRPLPVKSLRSITVSSRRIKKSN